MPARYLFSLLLLSLSVLFLAAPSPAAAQGDIAEAGRQKAKPVIGHSGLPVPRFVNLKGETTNARVGPSMDYPVRYVFNRKGLPVRVIAETPDNVWRKVEDSEGETMWIHQSQLVSASMVLITGRDTMMLARPARSGEPRAALQAGVLARLETCEGSWCRLRVDNYRGWVEKSALWGVE